MRTEFSSHAVLKRAVEDFKQRLGSGGLIIPTDLAELASRPLAVANLDRGCILEAATASQNLLASSANLSPASRNRQLVLEATAAFYGKRNWDDLCGAIPKTTEHFGHFLIEVVGLGATASACMDDLSFQLPDFTSDEPGRSDRPGIRRVTCEGDLTLTRRVVVNVLKRYPSILLTFCAYGKSQGPGTAESFRGGELLGSITTPRKDLLSTEDAPDDVLMELLARIARHVRNDAFALVQNEFWFKRAANG